MQPNQASILNSDRVSLIKFTSRLRRIFSLVPKDSNFAQLKIQFEKLVFDADERFGNLPKALHSCVVEFHKHLQKASDTTVQDNSAIDGETGD